MLVIENSPLPHLPEYLMEVKDTDQSKPFVTFLGAALFIRKLFLTLAAVLGQRQDQRSFQNHPMTFSVNSHGQASRWWSEVRRTADGLESQVPRHLENAVGKHCFTTPSHMNISHLWACAHRHARERQGDLDRLLRADPEYLQLLATAELQEYWFQVPAARVLHGPAHIWMMVRSINTIYNEMRLPTDLRCDPPAIMEDPTPTSRSRPASSSSQAAPQLTPEEQALKSLLQKYQHQRTITVKSVNDTVTSYRHDQQRICQLFDLAQELGAGTREGQPSDRRHALRLHLSLATMPPEARQKMGLPAVVPHADAPRPVSADRLPPMGGRGVLEV